MAIMKQFLRDYVDWRGATGLDRQLLIHSLTSTLVAGRAMDSGEVANNVGAYSPTSMTISSVFVSGLGLQMLK